VIPAATLAPRAALSRLAACCHGVLEGGATTEIAGVTHDSRLVRPGWLFVAVPGARRDGREFTADAVAAGAAAIACRLPRREGEAAGLPWLQVEDARRALADLAYEFWGHPDREIALLGVTGTNGKTSTAWLLEAILAEAGRPAALLGTLLYRFGGDEEAASHTTPEAPVLGRWLHAAARGGAWGAVMEVSSHGLALDRVRGLRFRAALFTNLDREHLDFHGDMDSYFRAKSRLFLEGLAPDGTAVCNADDPRGEEMAGLCAGTVVRFGRAASADLRIARLETGMEGLRMDLEGMASLAVTSPLVSEVNAYNIAAAAAAALALGVEPGAVARAAAGFDGVPGRMESVREGQPFAVVVDYAHTGRAMEALLRGVRGTGAGRIITVFGCGGDRDPDKRPVLGETAARHSDLVVLTDDNPRGEDPAAIIEQVLEGARRVEGREVRVERDRGRALRLAVSLARPGDAVVAAGKGAERYQQYGDEKLPWSDVETLRAALRGRREEAP